METQEEIKHCNTIAKFMGGDIRLVDYEDFFGWKVRFNETDKWGFIPSYDKSWSDLMPVIDKINNLGKEYNFTIHKTYCSCSVENAKKKMYKDFSFAHSEIKYVGKEIEAAYKLVIKFLEWYSANKPA